LAESVDTGSSSHTVTGADLLTDSGAESQRVRAGNGTLVTRDRLLTSRGTNNRLATELEGKLGLASGTTAGTLETESGLRSATAGTEGTFETLRVGSSTERLDTGDSSVTSSTGVFTIVTDGGVDELTVVRSSVTGA